MDKIPIFFALIKKNIILYTIIMNANFSEADFKNHEISPWTDAAIDVKNFKLSKEDQFTIVNFMKSAMGLHITFFTESSKYFDNPKKYFLRDSPLRSRKYEMFGENISSDSIRLGEFTDFGPPVIITLYKSSIYGYTVSFFFKNKEWFERELN